jgi:hypothetical protein
LIETIREKLINNLNLACTKARSEAVKILRKYPEIDFYLSNIAFGKIYEFRARNLVKANHQNVPIQLKVSMNQF